jgi:hypothetical protein
MLLTLTHGCSGRQGDQSAPRVCVCVGGSDRGQESRASWLRVSRRLVGWEGGQSKAIRAACHVPQPDTTQYTRTLDRAAVAFFSLEAHLRYTMRSCAKHASTVLSLQPMAVQSYPPAPTNR